MADIPDTSTWILGGDRLEIVQQLAAAWGVPSAVMGFCMWLLKRWIDKRDRVKEAREEERNRNRQKFEINLIQSVNASIALSEATARAVQRIPDAHCNGDMHKALEYASSVKHGQKDFLTSLGIQALYDD